DHQLHWASPYAEAFVRFHFSNRRLGDLFACAGTWDRAFECYGAIAPSERVRPFSDDDSLSLNRVLDALTIKFNSIASGKPGLESIAAIKALFSRACRDILGFPDVVFWQQTGGLWTPAVGDAPPGMARQIAYAAQAGPHSTEGC